MTRHYWALIHRYVGLAMTVFLILVGLTGSVLAFYYELDRWLNPELLTVPVRAGPMLDPFTLRARAEALEPRVRIDQIPLATKPDEAFGVWLAPKTDAATGKPYALPYNEIYLDPYTGEKIGARQWGRSRSPRRISFRFSTGCTTPSRCRRAPAISVSEGEGRVRGSKKGNCDRAWCIGNQNQPTPGKMTIDRDAYGRPFRRTV